MLLLAFVYSKKWETRFSVVSPTEVGIGEIRKKGKKRKKEREREQRCKGNGVK